MNVKNNKIPNKKCQNVIINLTRNHNTKCQNIKLYKVKHNYCIYLTLMFLLCHLYYKACCVCAKMTCRVAIWGMFSSNSSPSYGPSLIAIIQWHINNTSTTWFAFVCSSSYISWPRGISFCIGCHVRMWHSIKSFDVSVYHTSWIES